MKIEMPSAAEAEQVLCSECFDELQCNRILEIRPRSTCQRCGRLCLGYCTVVAGVSPAQEPHEMNKKSPTPANEKKLRRKLSEMTEQVRGFLARLDSIMALPSTAERDRRIAHLCNQLNLYNDGVRYFWCGVDYRKDTPWKGDLADPPAEEPTP